MSYKLFPAFVTRARQGCGWTAVTIDELSIARTRWFVFGAFNGGVALMIAGFLVGAIEIVRAGAILTAAPGAGRYRATTLWTLSFAFRAAAPTAAAQTSLEFYPSNGEIYARARGRSTRIGEWPDAVGEVVIIGSSRSSLRDHR